VGRWVAQRAPWDRKGLVRSDSDAARLDIARTLLFGVSDEVARQRLEHVDSTGVQIAFASLVQLQAGALLIGADAFFFIQRSQLAELAARHAVPVISDAREFPAARGLASYGASLRAVNRQLGIYAGRILNGEKPADLPVQQPTRFELVINLRTA
jgi:ABC-type uncharacterized transport system substrate-binding protein